MKALFAMSVTLYSGFTGVARYAGDWLGIDWIHSPSVPILTLTCQKHHCPMALMKNSNPFLLYTNTR